MRTILTIGLVICFYSAFTQVTPIKWKKASVTGSNALLEKSILLNCNRYALTTWYDSAKRYASQTEAYLDFGGTGERDIREAASEAFAIAVSIKTRIYDSRSTGVSKKTANQTAVRLVSSLAYRHKVNTSGGWGDSWQSALWTAFAGAAGWLLWDELPAKDQQNCQRMVEYEANRFNNYQVPYFKDRDGKLLNKGGDSKMEENSWNAMVLHVALAMMPQHEHHTKWMNKNIELLLSSLARPGDVNSPTVYHGKALRDWLNGSNLNSDGTVTNHGFIHPDYMSCTVHNYFNALMFGLAGQPIPQAIKFNTDVVYKAIVDLPFSSPPFVAPGGTIYVVDSDTIYYPKNTDWGRSRRMSFALMDCQADVFRIDSQVSRKGAYWEALHAKRVLDMQHRSADKRVYLNAKEDSFGGREEWVAVHAAMAWLTRWLAVQGRFRFSND